VDVCPNYHDLEAENGVSPMNFLKMLGHDETREQFDANHDVAFLFINVKGYALENEVRVRWSCNHSCELPWYNEEVPTIGVSLNYTNHLIDVPQLHTFVNAYGPNRENIRAAVEKICGKSAFKGKAGETVFCGRWDTRR
jgi:beta-N-acetylhexosaminidase